MSGYGEPGQFSRKAAPTRGGSHAAGISGPKQEANRPLRTDEKNISNALCRDKFGTLSAIGRNTWIEGRHPVTHGKSRSKPAVTMQDVRTRLATMDKGTLADMLVDQ